MSKAVDWKKGLLTLSERSKSYCVEFWRKIYFLLLDKIFRTMTRTHYDSLEILIIKYVKRGSKKVK